MADRLHTTANANPLVPLTPLQEFATEISTTVSGVAASARKIGRPRKPRVTRPRKYRKLDNLTRARIIGMRQAGLSFRKISKKTGVHYSTCYDAWRRFKATGRVEHRHTQPRRGTTKYTAAMKEFIVASFLLMISTSSRIVKEVFGYKYPHTSISISTVRRIRMEGRITLKSIRTRPVRWNTRPTIKKRQEYAAWRHNNIAATKCRYLFYDEQNYNIAMTSSVGYACRGVNAVLKKPTRTKGGATSLHLCVSPDYGYVAMHVVAKDTDAVTAASFIGTLAKRLKFFDRCEARYPGGGKSRLPWLLILDNEKQHHTANVRRQLEGHGIPYKFLPPYSPFLNPIQHCFSLVSGHLTSGFTFRELNGARSGSASNRQFKRLAKRIIAAAQATVTALKAEGPDYDIDLAFPPKDAEQRLLLEEVQAAIDKYAAKHTHATGIRREVDLRVGSPQWLKRAPMDKLRAWTKQHPRDTLAKRIHELRDFLATCRAKLETARRFIKDASAAAGPDELHMYEQTARNLQAKLDDLTRVNPAGADTGSDVDDAAPDMLEDFSLERDVALVDAELACQGATRGRGRRDMPEWGAFSAVGNWSFVGGVLMCSPDEPVALGAARTADVGDSDADADADADVAMPPATPSAATPTAGTTPPTSPPLDPQRAPPPAPAPTASVVVVPAAAGPPHPAPRGHAPAPSSPPARGRPSPSRRRHGHHGHGDGGDGDGGGFHRA